MRAKQFASFYFGPLLAASGAFAGIASAKQPDPSAGSPLVPGIVLVVMLALSAATIAWERRDRRRGDRSDRSEADRRIKPSSRKGDPR